jgi:CAAX protease family protein
MNILAIFKNQTENRLRAGWRILGQQLLLVMALLVLEDYITAPFKSSISQLNLLLLDAITGILAFGISTWLAGKWLDHRPFADFGFHLSKRWWIQLGSGAALGVLLMATIFLSQLVLGYVRVIHIGFTVDPNISLTLTLVVMLIHYIGVAFTEEILFRGYILRNLVDGFALPNRKVTIVLAVLVSSVIFALPHAGNPNATTVSTIFLIVFGVMCAMGAVLTGELAIPMGLHLTWNFFQGNVFGFPVSGWELQGRTILQIQQSGPDWFTGGAFGPEAGMVGLLAMLLGITLIDLWHGRNVPAKENYVEQNQLTA